MRAGYILMMAGAAYDPDAQLYFDQLTGSITDGWKNAVNTLVLTLKSDGNFTLLDRMWIHASENQQNARISLVNPTSTAITEVNSPTWTANQGYTGDGSSTYLDSGFNPSLSGVNFTQNSACVGVYCRTSTQSSGIDMGHNSNAGANVSYIVTRFTDNRAYFRANVSSLGVISVASTDARGLFASVRTTSNNYAGWKNGSSVVTGTNTSGTMSNNNMFILAINGGGSPTAYSNRQISISFAGSGSVDQNKLYTAIQTFATTIGFNV